MSSRFSISSEESASDLTENLEDVSSVVIVGDIEQTIWILSHEETGIMMTNSLQSFVHDPHTTI